jgi:predicted transcriptional regulator
MSTKKATKQSTTETIALIDRPSVVGEMMTSITGQVATRKTSESEKRLTDTQLTALDLYERGFNVIPLKRHQKLPFVLKPLYTSRLHHCGPACNHRKGKDAITEMFRRKNIGVVVGRTSGNLVDLDCDTREAFLKMGEELTSRNIPFWAYTSSRGGHYFIRVLEGEIAKNLSEGKSKFQDVQIWGTRQYVAIPPSIHPSGELYQWVTPEPRFSMPRGETLPAVSIKELEWLGIRLPSRWEEPELFGLPEWAATLSYKNRMTLAAKNLPERSRNRPFYDAATDMKGNNVPYREAEKVAIQFAERNHIPSDKSLSDYKEEIMATLKSAYSKEREPARKREREYLREWQRAKLVEENYDWYGVFEKKALSRRKVFNALIERAKTEGRPQFRATKREVAEIANLHHETAMDAIHDLLDVGLIRKMKTKKRREPGVYSFLRGKTSQFRPRYLLPGSYSGRNPTLLPRTQAEHDIAKKLGMVAWYVWKYLEGNPGKKSKEIADHLCLKISSIRRALRVLKHETVGMVTEEGRIYYAEPKTDASLAEMAAYWYDGASPYKNKKESHKLEREMRNNKLVRQAIAAWEIKHGS